MNPGWRPLAASRRSVIAGMAVRWDRLPVTSPELFAVGGQMEGLHDVHSLGVGSGGIGAGLLRIRYVYGTRQCLQGRQSGSSPTRAAARSPAGFWTVTADPWRGS